jgi:hypothetical protein
VAPGISEFEELEFVALVFHFMSSKNGIGMIRDKADLLQLCILLSLLPGRASEYNESAFI